MSGYCTVTQVLARFPEFQRTAQGSVQDAEIQVWIDNHKAKIRTAFLARGVDPDALTLTVDQANVLRELNTTCAAADLAAVLQNTVVLQPGESALGSSLRKSCKEGLEGILQGGWNELFGIASSGFGGIGGAETDRNETPRSRGENRSFGKNQEF